MMDFNKLDSHELSLLGLYFETDWEADLFAAIIREELEVRVGVAISKTVGSPKIEEFDQCLTAEEHCQWLEQNCPDYKEIVINEKCELEWEIIAWRDKIPGLVDYGCAVVCNITVEDMNLSVRSYNALKRDGLMTVGDILTCGDLSNVWGLGQINIEEIKSRLREIFSSPDLFLNDESDMVFFDINEDDFDN